MERFLREWRQDATSRNQFETAIFVGDKVLALTGSDHDTLKLAELHFSLGNYSRAENLLTRHDLHLRSSECKYLAAHCQIKQGHFEDALTLLGDSNPEHLILEGERRKHPRIGSADRSILGKHGKSNGSRSETHSRKDARENGSASTIRFEAAMCFLRGLCYAKQNAFDRAKECYKAAVKIDVQCFEAFDQLMKNALMSPEEEWKFIDELNFDTISISDSSTSQQAAELSKMLYMTRLSKYKNPDRFTAATETLATHYKLASNPDLLLAKAEHLFTQCRFREALVLTESILADDRYNFGALPVHLACLHELNEKNALFLLAHDFADQHPEEPATWLAVGVYYLTIFKIAEARRFFSKASMMDPHFGPAWIGFAHTFAAEGEHDQAISAYSTAARLFQGTHLPQLFLGMQNLQLHNTPLAFEYLDAAYNLCKTDPLLLNELGVVAYHQENMEEAIDAFKAALSITKSIDSDPRVWIPTRTNLGHAYRRTGQWNEALLQFDEVLRQGGRDSAAFCAKGLVLLELGQPQEAVLALHEALTLSPQDAIANELLGKALDECAAMNWDDEDEIDTELEGLITNQKRGMLRDGDSVRARRRRRITRATAILEDDHETSNGDVDHIPDAIGNGDGHGNFERYNDDNVDDEDEDEMDMADL